MQGDVLALGMMMGILSAILMIGITPAEAGSLKVIQEQGRAMVRDAEEMVMHGGMGDGKAILHHCAEVAKQAHAILKVLPSTDEHGKGAAPHLQDVMMYCKRVAELGDQVIPAPA